MHRGNAGLEAGWLYIAYGVPSNCRILQSTSSDRGRRSRESMYVISTSVERFFENSHHSYPFFCWKHDLQRMHRCIVRCSLCSAARSMISCRFYWVDFDGLRDRFQIEFKPAHWKLRKIKMKENTCGIFDSNVKSMTRTYSDSFLIILSYHSKASSRNSQNLEEIEPGKEKKILIPGSTEWFNARGERLGRS